MDSVSRRTRACAAIMLLTVPALLRSGGDPNIATVSERTFPTQADSAATTPAPAGLQRERAGGAAPFGSEAATTSSFTKAGLWRSPIGCMTDMKPETFKAEFGQRLGPLVGWDNMHVIEIGEDRYLWLTHDSYLDYSFEAQSMRDLHPQLKNLAMIQQGSCFTLFHRGTLDRPEAFEPGRTASLPDTFFWPLGGERDGDVIKVFWKKMKVSDAPREPIDGIRRHPVATWIAEYDAGTLERLRFYQAPASRVQEPQGTSDFTMQYGFAVGATETISYLFGNPDLLNLAMNGGYYNGPHPATRMYLARVKRGRYDREPQYRTGTGWSYDPDDAVVISERWYTENTMQPRRVGKNRWMSVVKEDGFSGDEILIEIAPNPWGPWQTIERIPEATRYSDQFSYGPILMPWRSRGGKTIVMISENANSWQRALDNPYLYRPNVVTVDWPW